MNEENFNTGFMRSVHIDQQAIQSIIKSHEDF